MSHEFCNILLDFCTIISVMENLFSINYIPIELLISSVLSCYPIRLSAIINFDGLYIYACNRVEIVWCLV